MAPVFPLWDYENLARVDVASQDLLAVLRALDPVAAAEWTQKFDAMWEKYADIASRLQELEPCDQAEEELMSELDRAVGIPLLEDWRRPLLQEVTRKLGALDTGTKGVFYWSIGRGFTQVYHWCSNCWAGKLIVERNRRGAPVPPGNYRPCAGCLFLTGNWNCPLA